MSISDCHTILSGTALLDQLEFNMNDIAKRFNKDLIIAEVSMGFTMDSYQEYEKLADSERQGVYATKT